MIFIILTVGTWYLSGWWYSERMSILNEQMKLLEQRLSQRASSPADEQIIVPLPSPISLGASHNTFLSFRPTGQNRGWMPAPEHEDATIDWRSVPNNVEVYAEVFVNSWSKESGLVGRARVINLATETVVSFTTVIAAPGPFETPPSRFTSEPLPRGVGLHTYRLEVSADDHANIIARGRLLYRRSE